MLVTEILTQMLRNVRWLAADLHDAEALAQVEQRAETAVLLDEKSELIKELGRITDRLRARTQG